MQYPHLKAHMNDPDRWYDWDGVMYELGRDLEVFVSESFLDVKGVFWSDNDLGNMLQHYLDGMCESGTLEYRDNCEYRWIKDEAP